MATTTGKDKSKEASDDNDVVVPPKITPFSGVLSKGKIVVRPIAFKPVGMPTNSRFNNAGERYGSTPILARPGSHLTLYGSSNDLRHTYSCSYHHHHHLHHTASSCNNPNKKHSLNRKSSISPPKGIMSLSSLPPVNIHSCESLNTAYRKPSPATSLSSHHSSNNYRLKPTLLVDNRDRDDIDDMTPSPSDSGVAELEAALRERDSEVVYLRQTMEHNEQAIIRVYQEKERSWERDRVRIKNAHDSRLRALDEKIIHLEQLLLMQSYQVQQEQNEVRREAVDLRQELDVLRGRLEETEWSLCQKTGESSLLKAQLKEAQTELQTKNHELLKSKNRNTELQREFDTHMVTSAHALEQLKTSNSKLNEELREANKLHLHDAEEIEAMRVECATLRQEIVDVCQVLKEEQDEKEKLANEFHRQRKEDQTKQWTEIREINQGSRETDDVKQLQREIDHLQNQLLSERTDFEQERVTWAQEKEKVLRYQRQLQLNYVQMYRKTRALEAKIESLNLETNEDSTKNEEKNVVSQPRSIEISPTIQL